MRNAINHGYIQKGLLNHMRYMNLTVDLESQLEMEVQCKTCKQFMSEDALARHADACAKDPYKTWTKNNYAIPVWDFDKFHKKEPMTKKYVCVACGFKSNKRKTVISHLSKHPLEI